MPILGGIAARALPPWTASAHAREPAQWRAALAALTDRDFDRARSQLYECAEVSPLHAETQFLLARTCRRSGDLAGWQLHLKKAEILQWPKVDIALEATLGETQSGDLRGAGQRLIPLLDSPRSDKELILEALVRGFLETNRWQEALEWATLWIDQSPDDWQPLLYRGQAFQLMRSLRQAMADYQRVLELRADHVQARLRLADVLLIERQFEPALAQYQAHLQTHPDDPAALVGAATCQFSMGQLEASRATLKELFAENKEKPTASERNLAAGSFLQAKLALAEGSPAEALNWLRRAEALVPDEIDIVYNLAVILRQLGKPVEAGRYERKLEDLRQYIKRLEDLRKGIGQDPDNVSLYHQAGVLSLRAGRQEEAVQWFKSALALDPGHRPTHETLADFLEKSGDTQRALYHRERAEGR